MSTRRPFDFSQKIRIVTLSRQKYRCAACGKKLAAETGVEAHHVVPNQSANPANPRHRWVGEEINCVVLDSTCHREDAHLDGNFQSGPVAVASFFKFSHGANAGAHKKWVVKIDALAEPLWDELQAKNMLARQAKL